MATLFTSAELLALLDLRKQTTSFFTNTFFPNVNMFETEAVVIDRIEGAQRLAPFVSPLVEGRPMKRDGFSTQTIKPAYLKPKMALTVTDIIKRRAGDAIGNRPLAPSERRELQIADDLDMQARRIEATIEKMSADVLQTGTITIAGEDYPTRLVDFGRNPAQTLTLTGAANLWSNGAAPIVTNLSDWARIVSSNRGGVVRDIVLGGNVFRNLQKNTEVRELYKNFKDVGGPLPVITPKDQDMSNIVYEGMLGSYRLWSNFDYYELPDGTFKPYLDPDTVLLIAGDSLRGTQAYGAIMDIGGTLKPAMRWPKMWEQQDPSAIFTMTQSAPIIIPVNPNATMAVKVQ